MEQLSFLKLSGEYQWIKKGVGKGSLRIRKKCRKKKNEAVCEVMMEYGVQEKIPWIQRWDQYFVQSRLKMIFPFLNSQLYGLLILAAGSAGFLILIIITAGTGGSTGWVLIWPGAVIFGGCYILKVLRHRRMKQTEKELIPF